MVQNSLKQGLSYAPRNIRFLPMLLAHTLETGCSPKLALSLYDEIRWKLLLFYQLLSMSFFISFHGASSCTTGHCSVSLCSSFKPLCKSSWSLLFHMVTANNTAECCLHYRDASSSFPVRPISVPPPPSVICRTFCLFLIIPAVFHHGPGSLAQAGSASVRVCPLLQTDLNQGGHLTH